MSCLKRGGGRGVAYKGGFLGELGWLKEGVSVADGLDDDTVVETSSWPCAECLKVSFFREH